MSSEVASAVIAASVSLVIALVTMTVSRRTTRETLKRDHDRQTAEFRRMMTTKLYDRRVTVYPNLFGRTAAFRRSALRDKPPKALAIHLRAGLGAIDDWHSTEGGLLLSPTALQRFYDLRRAINGCLSAIDSDSPEDEIAARREEVWQCKNRLREAMRKDLGFLFEEDGLEERQKG
ncbi:MAG: hypothetical protein RL238_2837 [Actinomycetota bacterium]|jgi:hypothetical protein